MARLSKPVRPTVAIALSMRVAVLGPDAAEQAFAAPQPHRHHVVDVDREAAVDLGDLRQVGDVLRRQPAAVDAAGQRLDDADHALEQRRLAGAVRADHRHQRAGLDRAVEMMHGRMPVVAQREIAELQLRGHRIAQNAASQISAITHADDGEPLQHRHAAGSRDAPWPAGEHGPDGGGDDGGE